MNLRTKKQLAARVLKVGINRIHFASDKFPEIKEAITKQDIKDLHKEGVISIKPIKGRKKIKRRKTKRGPGKIKKKINKRKQTYVKITRKLRGYLKELKNQGEIDKRLYWELRKKIRMRTFRSRAHLKEYLESIKKIQLVREIPEKPEKEAERFKKEPKKTTKKTKKSKKEVKKIIKKEAKKSTTRKTIIKDKKPKNKKNETR